MSGSGCTRKKTGHGSSSAARDCSPNTSGGHKWFTRVCAAAVIAATLIEIGPRYPVMDEAARQELQRARAELEAEAPPGAPAAAKPRT